MFKSLALKSKYISTVDNIPELFYTPVLKSAVKYDRVSGYFSSGALATYAEGLEYFAQKDSKFRLIISKDISEEDFLLIRNGYSVRKEIYDEMSGNLKTDVSLDVEKNISNLAYLIAIGVVDIKIAFKKQGIFHDKTGIFYDENGNIICFNGSENETEAGLKLNYESFSVVLSWLDANGFYTENITKSQNEFETLWDNKHNEIVVIDADKVILDKILQFNKGKLIMEECMLEKNAIILDYEGQLILRMNLDDTDPILKTSIYKIIIAPYVDSIKNNAIYFKADISYMKYLDIGEKIAKKAAAYGIKYYVSKRLRDYIDSKNIYIENRARIGISIKHKDNQIKSQFENYANDVNAIMVRKLRDIQMWDSFFMYAMEKSCNFSVPGSGKTSSALGVFAFLYKHEIVDRIVMIGPKNSFGSWIDEFNACFGNNIELKLFNCQDDKLTKSQKLQELKYNYHSKNLFLFNYESLESYKEEVKNILGTKALLVFDEVHKVKAIGGEYASHALDVAQFAGYTIAMTGTPIPNSYCDIYNLLHILFANEYSNFFGFDTRMLANPSINEKDAINTKIQPFFCRTTKKQLEVPLPNPDLEIITKATSDEQRLYEILTSRYKNNKLALIIRLLQAESNPQLLLKAIDDSDFVDMFDDLGNVEKIEEADFSEKLLSIIDKISITSKKKECLEHIEKLVTEGKTVILWCIFTDSIHSFEKLLSDRGIKTRIVNGEIPLEERQKVITSFKNKEFSVLITNPHTLAESVSLHTVCHDAIYFEYSYNLVHLLQSKDRIHRLGLPDGQYTQWYFLKQFYQKDDVKVSLNDNIYKRLVEKEEIMLDAIENHILEEVTTTQEDLDIIFGNLL